MMSDTGEEPDRKSNVTIGRVFTGLLGNLPPVGSKIVRIFTSSTFTDTKLERNSLMENVYPKLKEFCREKHGLEFQVVDMRWGIRDEATDDHMTTELCMQEIDNCQRLSMGPNFVVFLGQKYGYRPMPAKILASEFETICDVAASVISEQELLQTWYKKDTNVIPAVYILQPVSSILTNYNNKRHIRLMEADQYMWDEIMGKICRILRKCAYAMHLAKKLDKQGRHSYFMSVTEREIERGILRQENNADHCIAFIRKIQNVNMGITAFKYTSKFMDFTGRTLDEEASQYLEDLRDNRLPEKLPASNRRHFEVQWEGREGIEEDTHQDYLQQFCDEFYNRIKELVDRAVVKHELLSSDTVFSETLQHLHACEKFCAMFQGREEIVERVHQYIVGDSKQPLVLFGESGCGKTSLLAKSASMVFKWLKGSKPVMLLRFLGTSPDSSTLMPLLTSICQQISYVYDQPREEIPDELSPLCNYFKKLLSFASQEHPLVLYLDSLDQLSGAEGAHQLVWLPVALPEHVKIVVSTLPNYFNLLDTLKDKISDEQNFVQVFPLGPDLGGTILKSWLNNAKRQITEEQWVIVNEAISKCNLPLFVRLVYDEICRWHSYSKPGTTLLAFTIHDIIMKLFDRIEIQHGRPLVSRALGYITASKSGISEAELEDLLSLDEDVLNDVYQYHIPPVRRIPPLLWTRIRNDLPGYLSERQADGINVIDWYHRQFIDASRERYFRNLNFSSQMHSNISEFFLGTFAGIAKPFEYTELQRQRFHLEDRHGESDRKVPLQPLVFHNAKGEIIRYNLRKLNELPFHLIRSARYDDLYDKVLFNYKWLHAKLSCMPLQTVLSDFEDAIFHIKDKDIKLVADALRLSSSVLIHNPSMLGPQIIGRLLPYYSRNKKIKSLITQCDTDGLENCALVPAHHCLHTPGGPLLYSLEGHQLAPFGVAITSDAKYLVSVSNKFIIWDLATADVSRIINPGIEGIMQSLVISRNDRHAVTFTNINQVLIYNMVTGETKRLDKPLEGIYPILGISITTNNFAVWSKTEWCVYDIQGTLQKRNEVTSKTPIISVDLKTDEDVYVITSNGDENEEEMTLEVKNTRIKPFDFHSCLVLNNRRDLMLCNIGISDNNLAIYKLQDEAWKLEGSLDNVEKILGLTLSPDNVYVVATNFTGYTIWDLNDNLHHKSNHLTLPTGTRNIPQKNQLANQLVTFTKNNQYVVAGVRKNLYVWNVKTSELYKTLDAHFGRIIALTSITQEDYNIVVSSSLDKSIKVWNFDNIAENVNTIRRMEKPVETISIAANAYIGATIARNCVGIWNLQTGEVKCTLAHTGTSAIVTHALISGDGTYVVSAESGNTLIWNAEKEIMVDMHKDGDILALFLTEQDTKYIAVAKAAPNAAKTVCRTIPDGKEVFNFEYTYKGAFKAPVLTKDGLFFVVPANDKKGEDILSLYHARTGTHMHKMPLKYHNYKEYQRLVAMPHDSNLVAIIDDEKGNIWDVKKKCFVRSVPRWNGECMSNGKVGLYASQRGGLELIELKHGQTLRTLLHKVAEGVFSVKTRFTKNDQHVLYYHSGHRTVRVFRIADGKCIANYKAHADLKDMVGTEGGASVALCAIDGSVTTLTIADPADEYGQEVLQNLRSGMPQNQSPEHSPAKTSTLKMIAPIPELLPGLGSPIQRAPLTSSVPKSSGELGAFVTDETDGPVPGKHVGFSDESSRSSTPMSTDSATKPPNASRRKSTAKKPPSPSRKFSAPAKSYTHSQNSHHKISSASPVRKKSAAVKHPTPTPNLPSQRKKSASPTSFSRRVSAPAPPSPSKTITIGNGASSSSPTTQTSNAPCPTDGQIASPVILNSNLRQRSTSPAPKPRNLPPLPNKTSIEPGKKTSIIPLSSQTQQGQDSKLSTSSESGPTNHTSSQPSSSKIVQFGQISDLLLKSNPTDKTTTTAHKTEPQTTSAPSKPVPQNEKQNPPSQSPQEPRISLQGEIVTAKHRISVSTDLGSTLSSTSKRQSPLPDIKSRTPTPGSSTPPSLYKGLLKANASPTPTQSSSSGASPSSTPTSVSTIDMTVASEVKSLDNGPKPSSVLKTANGVDATADKKSVSLGAAMHVARAVGKAKNIKNQKSKACLIS